MKNKMQRKIKEIRLANLELAIEELGSAAKLAEKIDAKPSYISQIRNQINTPSGLSTRGVGDNLANRIEKALGKPDGWMDVDHSNGKKAVSKETLKTLGKTNKIPDEDVLKIIEALSHLSKKDRKKILDFLDLIVSKNSQQKK